MAQRMLRTGRLELVPLADEHLELEVEARFRSRSAALSLWSGPHILGGRAVPSQADVSSAEMPVDVIERVPLFANMSPHDTEGIAALFKERRFAPGETITKEGTGGAAFFVIESGQATVSVGGQQRDTLSAGDYFGEIALIDEGARSATVTADTELVCYGLTYWEFRPLVQQNATIGWNLLQTLVRRLRTARDDGAEPG